MYIYLILLNARTAHKTLSRGMAQYYRVNNIGMHGRIRRVVILYNEVRFEYFRIPGASSYSTVDDIGHWWVPSCSTNSDPKMDIGVHAIQGDTTYKAK